MKGWAGMAMPIALAFASCANAEPLASLPVGGLPRWQWAVLADREASMRIDLVRADVTVVSSVDRHAIVKIATEGSAEDAVGLWIDVTNKDGVYIVSDRFPRRSTRSYPIECLPPPDERGDFWLVPTKLRVNVAAPIGWPLRIMVAHGSIRDLRLRVQ
jgi:hypothetical protein